MNAAGRAQGAAPDEWLSIGEAAALTGLSTGTVYRNIREAKLAAYDRMGRTVLRRADVSAFMQPRRRTRRPVR